MTASDYAYQKRWRYERAQGIKRIVDATAARNHIAGLEGAGWSSRAIAAAADVAVQSVTRIKDGRPNANRRVVAAILRVPLDQMPTTSKDGHDPFVSRVGTVRRIQALMTIGWSCKAMAEHLSNGYTERWLHNKLNQQGRWVRRSTHDEVARLYRDLSTRPGPSEITRQRARARGFASPMDWDDIDRDLEPERDLELQGIGNGHREWRPVADRHVDHDEAVVRRLVDEGVRVRHLTHSETQAAIDELLARGVSVAEIERTYHLNASRGRRAS